MILEWVRGLDGPVTHCKTGFLSACHLACLCRWREHDKIRTDFAIGYKTIGVHEDIFSKAEYPLNDDLQSVFFSNLICVILVSNCWNINFGLRLKSGNVMRIRLQPSTMFNQTEFWISSLGLVQRPFLCQFCFGELMNVW